MALKLDEGGVALDSRRHRTNCAADWMDGDLSWRIIRASVPGTSHAKSHVPCQDNCFADTVSHGTGNLLLAFVSDGAGSATCAAEGSELAVAAARNQVEEGASLGLSVCELREDVIHGWLSAVQDAISRAAESYGLARRDFACTLLGAVVDTEGGVFFQVGDGAIVVADGLGYAPVTWPEEGYYANSTHFLTDDDALDHAQIRLSDRCQNEVALFSDGLQRLALEYQTRTAHVPFFRSLFLTLRRARREDCDALDGQLRRWLDSEQVNERTDDDKTLVMATRILENREPE